MDKYRKKPVVIEAFQMNIEHQRTKEDWPHWLHEAWNREEGEVGCVSAGPQTSSTDGFRNLTVQTLEGVMAVALDSWIIRGIKGELYPCEPDIFEATYEVALADYPVVKTPNADHVYGFAAWLTTRSEGVTFGSAHDCGVPGQLIGEYCKANNLEASEEYPDTFIMPS